MSIKLSAIRAGYGGFRLGGIDLEIAKGGITALIGPNGCGKSTLLRVMARHLNPRGGQVLIGGDDIARLRTKEVSKRVTLLPQHPVVPQGITVAQLVGYGRAPHQNMLGMRTEADEAQIAAALKTTSMTTHQDRLVGDLSGGQRQRAFLAMVIAQDTPYLLLDEPTSYLDIRYQFEVLEVMRLLASAGKTLVVVLHDIAQAARYASDLVVMEGGVIHARGRPADTLSQALIKEVYGVEASLFPDPVSGTPAISPIRLAEVWSGS